MRLQGKMAIVTGSSRGLGRAMALAFAREGADVLVNYAGREDAAKIDTEILYWRTPDQWKDTLATIPLNREISPTKWPRGHCMGYFIGKNVSGL